MLGLFKSLKNEDITYFWNYNGASDFVRAEIVLIARFWKQEYIEQGINADLK